MIWDFDNIKVFDCCHELTELSKRNYKDSKRSNYNIHNTSDAAKYIQHSKNISVVSNEHGWRHERCLGENILLYSVSIKSLLLKCWNVVEVPNISWEAKLLIPWIIYTYQVLANVNIHLFILWLVCSWSRYLLIIL
jgi:hypothetical protein